MASNDVNDDLVSDEHEESMETDAELSEEGEKMAVDSELSSTINNVVSNELRSNSSSSEESYETVQDSQETSRDSADTFSRDDCDDVLPNLNESNATTEPSSSLREETTDDSDADDFRYVFNIRRPEMDSDDSSRTSTEENPEYVEMKSEVDRHLKLGDYSLSKHPHWRCHHPVLLLNARERGCGPCDITRATYKRTSALRFGDAFHASPAMVSRLRLQSRFRTHSGCVNALNFNKSGTLIASGSDDLNVTITEWMTGRQVYKFKTGHRMNVFETKFLPETSDLQVVTCSRDAEVRLCVLSTTGVCRNTRRLVEHHDACHKFSLPPGEPAVVISAGEDGRVNFCDIREDRPKRLVCLPHVPLYSISTNPAKPCEFVVSGKDEFVRMYDRRMLSVRASGSSDPSESADRPTRYPIVRQFCPSSLRPAPQPPKSPNEKPSKKDESTSSQSETTNASDSSSTDSSSGSASGRRSGRRRHPFRCYFRSMRNEHHPKYTITSVTYNYNGKEILASYNDEDIYLFDSSDADKEPLHKYMGHRNMQTVKGVNFFGPRSEYVVSGSDDGYIYIWDKGTEGLVQWLFGDAGGVVNVLEPHPSMPVLATSGLDSDVKIWTPAGFAPNAKPLLEPLSPRPRRRDLDKEDILLPKWDKELPFDVNTLRTRVARNWIGRKSDATSMDTTSVMDFMRMILPDMEGYPLFHFGGRGSSDEDGDDESMPPRRRRRADSGDE